MKVPKPKHRRRVPTQGRRNRFTRAIKKKVMMEEEYRCQMCGGRATQIHHVMPRSRQGRGVYTNAMAVCNDCHSRIHKDNDLLDYWINLYAERYGPDFYKDRWDLYEWNVK